MGLVIEALSDANAGEWDDLVRNSPDGWSFSLAGWQRLILNVNEWGLEDHSFAVREGARLVAAMPLQYRPAHKVMGSSGWGGSGPIIAAERTGTARAHLFSLAIEEAKQRCRSAGAQQLDVSCSPVTRASLANRWSVNPFVLEGLSETPRISQIIDLSAGHDRVWNGLSKSARKAVRAAERGGYTCRKVEWADSLDVYYDIHCETYRRDGLQPHPKAYFAGIAKEIAPQGAAVLFAAFDPANEIVAFHNDSRWGVGANYHTGCSRDAARDAGVSYQLFWRAVEDAIACGFLWYDAGWIFPNTEDQKQRGLTLFKTRFGGEPHRAFTSTMEFPSQESRAASAPAERPTPIKSASREAYEKGEIYRVETICNRVKADSPEYIDRLLSAKMALLHKHKRPGLLVDLCCATGEHLFEAATDGQPALGLDFSVPFIAKALELARACESDISFAVADAKQTPLADSSVGTLFSFSALYAIEGVEAVFAEIARILKKDGRCVLDLGNSRSLNSICVRAYTELPPTYHMTPKAMRALATANGLRVIEQRAFQILPLWAGKPRCMAPLLHPGWKKVMARRIGGRMLDEWVSNFPLLKPFAFRHLLVCEKRS